MYSVKSTLKVFLCVKELTLRNSAKRACTCGGVLVLCNFALIHCFVADIHNIGV